MTPAIEINNLQKVTDRYPTVDLPALTLEPGEIAALVGPPGSGKAELLQLLTGRTGPTAGSIRLTGIDPHRNPDQLSRRVGVLFAEDGLYQQRSALQNLVFYCQLHGLPKARAAEVLDQVGLADRASTRTGKLSPGLARRLAFGRTILHRPRVLLLVEPFARCDEPSITLLSQRIRALADDGTAVLILADDTAHLALPCDTIYVLNQGRIVEVRRPGEAVELKQPFKIPVRLEDKVMLVNPSDILYVEAEGGRSLLHTVDGRLAAPFTLSELEGRLTRSGFFRAHRSYLVNLQRVKEVIPYTRNSYSLRLDDQARTEIPLSKTAAAELRQLLGY